MADTPTPEQVAMARRIAADGYYPLREDQALVPYGRERILSGDMDHTVQVQTALAAIIETTEAAAKLADDHARLAWSIDDALGQKATYSSGRNHGARTIATLLRNFEHLGAQHG